MAQPVATATSVLPTRGRINSLLLGGTLQLVLPVGVCFLFGACHSPTHLLGGSLSANIMQREAQTPQPPPLGNQACLPGISQQYTGRAGERCPVTPVPGMVMQAVVPEMLMHQAAVQLKFATNCARTPYTLYDACLTHKQVVRMPAIPSGTWLAGFYELARPAAAGCLPCCHTHTQHLARSSVITHCRPMPQGLPSTAKAARNNSLLYVLEQQAASAETRFQLVPPKPEPNLTQAMHATKLLCGALLTATACHP